MGVTDLRDCEANIGFEDDLNQMLNLTYTNREPNLDARKFYRLVEDGNKLLYHGSKKFSRLSFLVRMYHWKCLNGVTQIAFGEMLRMKFHAKPVMSLGGGIRKKKIMDRKKDEKLWHPADGVAWKTMDAKYPTFSLENRNVKLDSNHKWRSDRKRSNGQVEVGQAPAILSRRMITSLLDGYKNTFGKVKGKRKVSCDVNPWNKKSIFFDLPYWSENSIRHNLDVLLIEKNIFDSILVTLLNISGKLKGHVNARLELQELSIRKILHPTTSTDGNYLEIKATNFDMTNKEKDIFCSVLESMKFPHGFASNISKCVQDKKVVGYKSHDAHIIMQYLFQITVKKALKPEVAIRLIRLGEFFRGICSKVIEVDDVKKLQKSTRDGCTQLRGHRYILFNYDDKEVKALIETGGDFMTFHLHCKGEFHKHKYGDGLINTVKDFELDVFSYLELMEWINQLGYKEFGGIYVRKEENNDGWELITDDAVLNEYTIKSKASKLDLFINCDVDNNVPTMRQMQPHVIVRPKRTPVKPKEDNPKKLQFVTLKDINEEKTRKMNKSRKKTKSTDKVLKSVVIEREAESELMGMAQYMKRFEIPNMNTNLGEGGGVQQSEQSGLNAYIMGRNKHVEENKKKIKELGSPG
ncbi:hypothetical protein AgCh_023727 [Apium graveolens]